ncbi:hypothetical protein L227DRAFT_642576 [Lentinus tigrinus ALCF2SS1-6]|uniref:MARVEL domain-containing protein n=1 Tax=Lentinus tigrinus ALCF2SS1-6 TaxID=1328759 RepID=A0A5C2SPB1_9APHY|nr:hypothetical protein L227DRAFT_642576 [Lentinus tigrinus ALCF2SS1-6]
MKWLIYFRETALTLATITAIIAHAMGSLTINQSVGVLTADITYAHIGVGAGVATILSLPMILLYDMAQERSYSATVLFELVWNIGLSVVWIVAGVKAMGITGSMFKDCSATSTALFGLCQDANTLVQFAFASAAILMVYSAALGFAATSAAAGGKPIWTSFPLPGKKH